MLASMVKEPAGRPDLGPASSATLEGGRPRRPQSTGGSLWPKEHGAYAQWFFPTLSALIFAGGALRGIALAAATLAGFLAHEPLLVVLGRRGGAAKRNLGERARRRLAILGLTGLLGTLVGLVGSSRVSALAFLAVSVAGSVVGVASLSGNEKSVLGETLVGGTFAASVIPIALVSQGDWGTAVWIASIWAGVFAFSTLVVHAVLARGRRAARGAGYPRFAVCAVLALAPLLAFGVPRLLVVAPSWLLATWAMAFEVSPRELRTLGWAMVVAFAATAGLLPFAF